MLKIESQFRKSKNNIENVFRFWDKCILKASNKWPLLRREYMSSAVNGWTNSPKTLHITQRDFFKLNYLQKDQKIWLRHCRSALNSVSARLPCYLSKHHLKGDFLDIYLTTFFGVRKFKNTSAMRVTFLLKMFKIESKFRKWKKKEIKNVFRFWDNCIWKCLYKLCLLRREYVFVAVSVLRNSPKILHITQRDFFNLNCLHRDQ